MVNATWMLQDGRSTAAEMLKGGQKSGTNDPEKSVLKGCEGLHRNVF